MKRLAGIFANLAIPVWLCITMFSGAFAILTLPESLTSTFGILGSVLWAQMFFWFCSAIVAGLIIQIVAEEKKFYGVPTYVWFEYPGLIATSILLFTYCGALIVKFGIVMTFVAAGVAFAIGVRFFFRWLELHLTFFRKNEKETTITGE